MPDSPTARLSLSHATVAVSDLDAMLDFYCGVLGFAVTNRGPVGDGAEMAFISQDPTEHHQMVFVSGLPRPEHQFVMADHMAFRTGTLDDLRAIGDRLDAAGIEGVIPINHGNAWSLYFNDPEGNGLECFVDSPFHVRAALRRPARPLGRRRHDRGRHPGQDRERRRVPVDVRVAGRVPGPPRRRGGVGDGPGHRRSPGHPAGIEPRAGPGLRREHRSRGGARRRQRAHRGGRRHCSRRAACRVRRRGDRRGRRLVHWRGARRAARRMPRTRHRAAQRRGSAADSVLSTERRSTRRCVPAGGRRPGPVAATDRAGHGRASLRAHRRRQLGDGEDAEPDDEPVPRHTARPRRHPEGALEGGRHPQRHRQPTPARAVRHGPPTADGRAGGEVQGDHP